jgi:hypothetical protein
MRPTKHTDPSEDELIAHIKDSLMGHEERYASGSWERFAGKEKKPRGLIFWIGSLGSAAAVFLIAIGLYFFRDNTPDQPAGQAVVAKAPALKPPAVIRTDRSPVGVSLPEAARQNTDGSIISSLSAALPGRPESTRGLIQADAVAVNKTDEALPNANVSGTGDRTKPVREPEKVTLQEFLNRETLIAKQDKKSVAANNKSDKWEMGVMVAPSFGNTSKLNMGYGLSMGYALSSKVSLSSGVSYNELAASKDLTASGAMSAPAATSIASETKSLRAVETSVTGIDVPIEIRYHFNKNFYANVGVSAFAVLNRKQSNSYVEEKLVERSSGFAADNKDVISTFVVAEKTKEEAPKSEISEDRYLGFYNFSFGYKQKVSGSKSISIEPFMKVPMKEVSKENLRLIGTGVRLKFDF